MNQLIVRKLRKRLTWLMHILNIKIIRWLYQCPSLCVAYSRSIVYQLQVNRSRKCQKLEAGALTTYTRRVWIVTGEKFPQAWWLLHLAGFFLSLLSRKKKTLKWKETMMINCLLCFYSIFVAGLLKLFMTKSRANSVRMRNHRSYEVSLISRRTNGAKIIRSPKFYFNLGAVLIVDR